MGRGNGRKPGPSKYQREQSWLLAWGLWENVAPGCPRPCTPRPECLPLYERATKESGPRAVCPLQGEETEGHLPYTEMWELKYSKGGRSLDEPLEDYGLNGSL